MFLALYVKTRANILVEPKLLSHLRCASYEIKTDTEFVLRVQDKFLLLQPLSGRSSESIVFRSVAKRQICYLKSNKNEINEDILTAFQNFKKKTKNKTAFRVWDVASLRTTIVTLKLFVLNIQFIKCSWL